MNYMTGNLRLLTPARLSLMAVMILMHSSVTAANEHADRFHLNGFASIGYLDSNGNPYYGDTGDGDLYNRELALNGLYEVNNRLNFRGQLLYRNAGDIVDDQLSLDFLLADFTLVDEASDSMGLRLGRVKLPYGIYNTTRDVPQSRPGIYVPKSVYFDSFRDVMLSLDGISVYGDSDTQLGLLDYQAYVGRTSVDQNSMEHYLFSKNITGEFKSADLYGLQLFLIPKNLQDLRLGYSLMHFETSLKDASTATATSIAQNFVIQHLLANAVNPLAPTAPELAAAQVYAATQTPIELAQNWRDYVTFANLSADIHLLSAQYSIGDITLTGEYMRIDSDYASDIANANYRQLDTRSEGYYGQIEWQVAPEWSLMFRYEELYILEDDKDGSNAFATGFALSPYQQYSKGYTIGARYDLDHNLSLSAEYSQNEGGAWLPKDDSINIANLQKDWSYFSLQLSYFF